MKKFFKIVISVPIAVVLAFAFVIVYIQRKFSIPYSAVLYQVIRKALLSLIELSLKVYDYGPAHETVSLTPDQDCLQTHEYASTAENLKELIQGYPILKDQLEISLFDNKTLIRSSYPFRYEPYQQERVSEFRERYHFDLLLERYGKTEFQQIVLLSDWTNRRWERSAKGAPIPKDLYINSFNGITFIENAKKGQRYWCQIYAMTFIQVAASVGFNCRLISLSRDGYQREHAVVEVWSSDYDKWVLMDVDYNLYYVRDGVPQNALELHNAWVNREIDAVHYVKGYKRPRVGWQIEDTKYKLLDIYAFFYVDMRNDWYFNRYFRGHPAIGDKATLFWYDNRLKPIFNFYTKTNKIEELYWTLNQTTIYLKPLGETSFRLFLDTVTPNFKYFDIEVDDNQKTFLKESEFTWKLHRGINTFKVRSVNLYDRKGSVSQIRLYLN